MNENLNEALEHIGDRHLEEAANYYSRSRRGRWLGAIAAVLAVVIAWGAIWRGLEGQKPALQNTVPSIQGTTPSDIPTPSQPVPPNSAELKFLVGQPVYPTLSLCPNYKDYTSYEEYENAKFQWRKTQMELYNQPAGYADSLDSFFARSIPEFLSGEGNRAYSPLNVYLAMAMLAQTTGGESRQQILDLFGVDSIEALQTQAEHVWRAHYRGDGQSSSLLANSIWLDSALLYNADTVQTLAETYFASVFHGDLGTEEANQQLRSWINSQTGGLLEEQANNLSLDPETAFALASTCYFTAGWRSEFSEKDTALATFHCKDFDLTTQFMNQTLFHSTYYWGTDFGAVRLALNGDNAMWLILPDEGKTVEDVLESGEYWQMTQNYGKWENQQELTVNLSLPKFDISTQADLIEGMKNLGVTDIFDPGADFSPISDEDELSVNKIDHAVRVAVDEEGVIAASYTVISVEFGAAPSAPNDEIDFVLDRPFLFMVTSQDDLPLFTGVVEQP